MTDNIKNLKFKLLSNNLDRLLLILFLFVLVQSIQSQCLTPDNTALPQFIQGSTVYYTFDSTIPADASASSQKNQIKTAINNWNSANLVNCSGIQFQEGSGDITSLKLVFKNTNTGSAATVSLSELIFFGDDLIEATIVYNTAYTLTAGPFYDSTKNGYDNIFVKVTMHEIGHTMGLSHYTNGYPGGCFDQIRHSSVMNNPCGVNDARNEVAGYGDNMTTIVKSCDVYRLNGIYICPIVTPTPIPEPTIFTEEYCDLSSIRHCWYKETEYCNCQKFAGVWNPDLCWCDYYSPILIDVQGDGFSLTSASTGIQFDMRGNGDLVTIAWTSADSDDAWLSLDRNNNGIIDNGTELFGNFTSQTTAPASKRNGFLALAEFDKTSNGGNSDEVIDYRDSVFGNLRLWQDINHNGISESNELKTLSELGLSVLELDYKESKRKDEHGNHFRYRAKVRDIQESQFGRWAWDVFLLEAR